MAKIRVFGLELPFMGHVDQYIESVTFGIALDDRQELMFMKQQKFLYCTAELVQQTAMFLTP